MIGDRWGVTDEEVARRYPCDDLVGSPRLQAWRGVTVEMPPEALWPWVRQVQVAPYSYDRVDNRGRRSPRRLLDLAPARPGEHFTSSGGRPLGRLLAVEEPVHYTGRVLGAVLSYVLVPAGEGRTRLLLKVVAGGGSRWLSPLSPLSPLPALVSVGDLVMARRQLLNLRRLAEEGAR